MFSKIIATVFISAILGSSGQAETILVPALPDGQVDATAVFESLTINNSEFDGDDPNLYWGEVLGKRFGAIFGSPPSKQIFSLTIGVEELPEPVVHLLANTLTAAHCAKADLDGDRVDWDSTSMPFEGGPLDGGWSVKTACRDKLESE